MIRATLTLALVLWSESAPAQTMRPFTTFRQMHGETRLATRLDYAAGTLRLAPGRPAELYRMDLFYDEDRYIPVSDFDPASGAAILGLKPSGHGGVRVVSRKQLDQVATVALSPRVDLALDLALGAVDADLDLGGLRVTRLKVKTGASRAVVRFSQPNASRCDRATISAGAAEVSVLGLGNSRCDEIEFEGGMGKVVLDFSGAWSSSAEVDVRMAVGELTLRLPRRVGVRIRMDKFLASFDPRGMIRQADAYESAGYARAQRHLNIDLATAVGSINVAWVDGR